MTIEEKARAYDEALDRMKYVVIVPKDEKALQALKETIFPELRESEDERIIEEIKFAVMQMPTERQDTKERCIAWLEKQKESLHIPESCKENADSFTSEDERIRKDLIYDIERLPMQGVLTHRSTSEYIAYLEKQKEQKQNQSEEEREYVKTIKGLISDFIRDSGGAISDVTYYQRICDWLDERHIEQKPAWSKEDEEMLDAMIDIVSGSLYEPLCPRKEMLAWLKSLRPSWKPSEEQMEVLQCAIAFMEIRKASDYDISPLKDLYEQLKKL